ncbi:prolyl oligopeptidase family serine peptidase [Roseateles paludis]|uniref:prolyl oligopeptidase n=1 Tax=Roseateles paludis TaxID=3145238 RepID=A0ABV0FXG8_9BURK
MKFISLGLLALLPLAAIAQSNGTPAPNLAPYPATPQKPVTDVYHGTPVVDAYRWMEDMKSPAFQDWLKTQASYAADTLARLPGRAALRARLAELVDAGESTGDYTVEGDQLFYMKRQPGKNQPVLWLRQGLAGSERALLDPNAIPGEPGKHAIDWMGVAPGGKLVALGLSKGGSENSVLRVLDVSTGKLLSEAISHTGLNQYGVGWLPDASGFYYNRHPEGERYNKSAVYLHKLGQDAAQDTAQFGWEVSPKLKLAIEDLPYLHTASSSHFVLAQMLHGDAVDRSFWVAPRNGIKGAATAWRRIVSPADRVIRAALVGDAVYAISQKTASRRELLRLDLRDPKSRFKTVLQTLTVGDSVLQTLTVGDDAVYVKALDAGVSKLWRVGAKDGKASSVPLPFEGTLREIEPLKGGKVLLLMSGWTQPAQSVVVDVRSGKTETVSVQKPLALDTTPFKSQRVMVKSHDGVLVPLSIVSRKDMVADGQRPTILTAYGAYGITREPEFSATRLAWLERGGVTATCHVRGGGELGEEWHQGAHILNKQNTVADFIACAEYLIAQKITSPKTLAGTGGSAGGITIGGTITQRPDLLAAAQSAVGLSDMLRMETTPNGPPNVHEFGTVTNPAHFKAMHAISPYHRVQDGKAYPAVIVTTGANDPRVEAWLPAKFAARLQAANPESYRSRPVLLRVDFEAGHGMGSSVAQRLDETAAVWSFFLWQFGDAAFQPKN